jgi:hypothetical protein
MEAEIVLSGQKVGTLFTIIFLIQHRKHSASDIRIMKQDILIEVEPYFMLKGYTYLSKFILKTSSSFVAGIMRRENVRFQVLTATSKIDAK